MAFGMVAGRLAPAEDDLDPVKMMPDTHKLLFENPFVRVIEGRVPAGGYEPKHRHPHCVLVNLADFDSEIRTIPDGEWKHMHRAFGTATWSDATVHEVRIVGKVPSHTVRVELKC
jgi:aspartyl/asparaginyl beta-hydroxylase (cupin superfamily)